MGIPGLLPFLDKCSRKTNISEFSGQTVAVDTYCWLHKGAFSCADKIIMGQSTNAYVMYCMKLVNMLLSHHIKPILVFDGRYLPAKAVTEAKRRESRLINRKRAAELIKLGNIYEGKNLMKRSLDVTHRMALNVIKECQAHNIDCIVAPYEADAQLAYLNLSGIVEIIITEDSDLILFGCKKILFKMDLYGYGTLVEQNRLHLSMGLTLSNFNMDKFLYMCILSGCDYLASLPGIGLIKACKFIVNNKEENIYHALLRIPCSLNMKSLIVTKEYRDNFMQALVTFKHQIVYCPLKRQQVRLNIPTAEITDEQLAQAGRKVDEKLAWQLALGNYDPCTFEKLHDFDPDNLSTECVNLSNRKFIKKHISIWSKDFQVPDPVDKNAVEIKNEEEKPTNNFSNKVPSLINNYQTNNVTSRKRTFEEFECDQQTSRKIEKIVHDSSKSKKKLLEKAVPPKLTKLILKSNSLGDKEISSNIVENTNTLKNGKKLKEISPNLLYKLRRRLPAKNPFKQTVIDEAVTVDSKFFVSPRQTRDNESIDAFKSTLSNVQQNQENNLKLKYSDCSLKMKNTNIESRAENKSNISSVNCRKSINSVNSNIHLEKNKNEFSKKFQEQMSGFTSKDVEDDVDLSISQKIFSECTSHMFSSKNEHLNKIKSDKLLLPHRQGFSQLSDVSSAPCSIKNRDALISKQQSLLTMYGFQKKILVNIKQKK